MIRDYTEKHPKLPGFETPFDRELDPKNRWVKLAEVVPWDTLAQAYYSGMSRDQGTPAKSARLMVGAMILKHRQRWTDEETVLQIQENPYLQYFCGFAGYKLTQPFAPSLFVEMRKRMGVEMFARFEAAVQQKFMEIRQAKEKKANGNIDKEGESPVGGTKTEAVADSAPVGDPEPVASDVAAAGVAESSPAPEGKLIIDATVAEQEIRYPTDLGLLNEAREVSERLIDRLYPLSGESKKPRTYRQNARRDFLAIVRKRKPRQNDLRRAKRQQLQYLRRNLGHIDALLDRYAPTIEAHLGGVIPVDRGWPEWLKMRYIRQLWVIRSVYDQQQQMYDQRVRSHPHRIVSLSQPHVRPIVRGKAGKAVEFGAKVSVSLDGNGLARVDALRWDAFNESADLPGQVEAFKKRYGHYPAVVLADGIYGTRDNRSYCKERGIRFGGKPLGRPRQETEDNREELREAKRQRRRDHLERIPIEGKFGQGKNRHGLAKIRAKLVDTSASWIRAIFLVMNLNLLVRFFFALNQQHLNAAFASLLTQMVVWQGLVKDMAGRLRLPQGKPMIAAEAF